MARSDCRRAGHLRRVRGDLEAHRRQCRELRLEARGAAARRSCSSWMPSRRPTWSSRATSISAACWRRWRRRPRRWARGASCSTRWTSCWRCCPTRRRRRREVYRLHEWLLARGLTGLITAKAGGDEASSDRPAAVRLHAVHGGLRGDPQPQRGAGRLAAQSARAEVSRLELRRERIAVRDRQERASKSPSRARWAASTPT